MVDPMETTRDADISANRMKAAAKQVNNGGKQLLLQLLRLGTYCPSRAIKQQSTGITSRAALGAAARVSQHRLDCISWISIINTGDPLLMGQLKMDLRLTPYDHHRTRLSDRDANILHCMIMH